MQRETSIKLTGLCHSVQGTAAMLAKWIGAPDDEITYTCAGINHMAWYVKYQWNGKDAYPLIRKAITERPEIYDEEIVRKSGCLLTSIITYQPIDGHNSEYNAWFRKRPDFNREILHTWHRLEPGKYAYVLEEYQRNENTWKDS